MKKLIFSAILAVIGMGGFSSCEKVIEPSKKTPPATPEFSAIDLRVFHDNTKDVTKPDEGKHYGCWGTGGNCMDDIVLVDPDAELIQFLAWVGMLFWEANVDAKDLSDYFTKNTSAMTKLFGSEIVEKVKKDDLYVKTLGDFAKGETAYVIFKTGLGETVKVFPFRKA